MPYVRAYTAFSAICHTQIHEDILQVSNTEHFTTPSIMISGLYFAAERVVFLFFLLSVTNNTEATAEIKS